VNGQTLVFTRTKHGADKVVRSLHHAGLSAEAIHGNKSQNQRERVLGGFRAGKLKTLVATDIAARGIDVDGVSHVINYDLPNIPESYVHRIGRTARAGADGIAISFCDHEERAFLRDIERLIRAAIPATDRRINGAREEQRPREDGHREGGRRNGGHRNGRGHHNGQRHGRSEDAGQREGHAHSNGQRQGQSENGEQRNGRGQGRPHGRPNKDSRHRSNGNGHHQAQNGARGEGRRDHGQQKPARAHQSAAHRSDGTIGTVAFMQRQVRHEDRNG
jgi:ATP-dependent RNA helicase RhlE